MLSRFIKKDAAALRYRLCLLFRYSLVLDAIPSAKRTAILPHQPRIIISQCSQIIQRNSILTRRR